MAQLPSWAQGRRPVRRVRRRLLLAGVVLFLLGLIAWLNYPFLPDPFILLFKRPTTSLTSESAQGQWAMNGRDLQQRRQVDTVRHSEGRVSWSQDLGEFTRSAPIAIEGTLYIGGYFKIVALDAESGVTLWETRTAGPVQSAAAVAGETAYFVDHRLIALDLETAETRWEFKAQDVITTSPVVAQGLVYIGARSGFLYALDAATGELIWKFPAEGPVGSSPALHDGNLFFTSNDGNLYILNARTGQERLRFRTPGSVMGTPVVDHGLVYFPSGGVLYAVDAGAKEVPGQYQLKRVWAQFWLWQVPGVSRPPGQQGGRWRITPGGSALGDILASPAVGQEAFYVGDGAGNFYARDVKQGQELWRFQAGSPIVAPALIAGDRVYFGDLDGTLYALDRSSGGLVWQLPLGSAIEVPPTFYQGRLYLRTSDGMLHAIE